MSSALDRDTAILILFFPVYALAFLALAIGGWIRDVGEERRRRG